jgi:hypothetical protein
MEAFPQKSSLNAYTGMTFYTLIQTQLQEDAL